jgi:hypothetical protein
MAVVSKPGSDWPCAADELRRVLRQHGIDPDAVADVRAAWAAFREFAQIEFTGLDSTPDSDNHGLIVQWGRYSWNDYRYSVGFTRQLAVVDEEFGVVGDERWPILWQVELELLFEDEPSLSASAWALADTGFFFRSARPRPRSRFARSRSTNT